jgi:hypothetical protein
MAVNTINTPTATYCAVNNKSTIIATSAMLPESVVEGGGVTVCRGASVPFYLRLVRLLPVLVGGGFKVELSAESQSRTYQPRILIDQF